MESFSLGSYEEGICTGKSDHEFSRKMLNLRVSRKLCEDIQESYKCEVLSLREKQELELLLQESSELKS